MYRYSMSKQCGGGGCECVPVQYEQAVRRPCLGVPHDARAVAAQVEFESKV